MFCILLGSKLVVAFTAFVFMGLNRSIAFIGSVVFAMAVKEEAVLGWRVVVVVV